jgi:glycerophosphoryl diester phosphodiesterase
MEAVFVWVIAHRGASGHAPENTMAAFRRAVELGATSIETDLHLTRDARIVALHDSTLDRTTNGRGGIHMKSVEDIRLLDAGSWFDSIPAHAFAGERVPLLEEVLEFSKAGDVIFYLEIKSDGTWGIEHSVVGALRDHGAVARVVILSFEPSMLESVHELDGTMMTGYLCEYPAPDLVDRALRVGARQLAPRGDLVTPDLVAEAHASGLQLVTWTINEPEQMRRLIAAGVDGIMTDFPDRLVKVLKES